MSARPTLVVLASILGLLFGCVAEDPSDFSSGDDDDDTGADDDDDTTGDPSLDELPLCEDGIPDDLPYDLFGEDYQIELENSFESHYTGDIRSIWWYADEPPMMSDMSSSTCPSNPVEANMKSGLKVSKSFSRFSLIRWVYSSSP